MTTYNRKKQETNAAVWNKNGDHPNDGSVNITIDGVTTKTEGKVVKAYAHQDGNYAPCSNCQQPLSAHGWIDNNQGGQRVCPGDYVLTTTVTNLLTENQATGTDKLGAVTGFTAKETGDTLASVATYGKPAQNAKCLSVACDGLAANQGVTVDATAVTAGIPYTFQAKLLTTKGRALKLDLVDNGTEPQTVSVDVVATGEHQDISATITPSAASTTVIAKVYYNGSIEDTLYLDLLQLANRPGVSNWGVGEHLEEGNHIAVKPAAFVNDYEEYTP